MYNYYYMNLSEISQSLVNKKNNTSSYYLFVQYLEFDVGGYHHIFLYPYNLIPEKELNLGSNKYLYFGKTKHSNYYFEKNTNNNDMLKLYLNEDKIIYLGESQVNDKLPNFSSIDIQNYDIKKIIFCVYQK